MAMGPGNDMFDSTRIIGQNIYLTARVSDTFYECARRLLLQESMFI